MLAAKESTAQEEWMQIIPQLVQSDNSAPLSCVLVKARTGTLQRNKKKELE